MTVRQILVLSLTGAAVLAGAVAALAMLGETDPAPEAAAGDPLPSRTSGSRSPTPDDSPSGSQSSDASPPDPSPPAPAPPAAVPAHPGPGRPDPAPPPPPGPDLPAPEPQLVTPRPGMDNVEPVPWRRAEPVGASLVRIHYESGVAPCRVLDHVEVRYGADRVAIGLFEGSDPAFPGAVCILIAQFKAVDVALDEALDGRPVVDLN